MAYEWIYLAWRAAVSAPDMGWDRQRSKHAWQNCIRAIARERRVDDVLCHQWLRPPRFAPIWPAGVDRRRLAFCDCAGVSDFSDCGRRDAAGRLGRGLADHPNGGTGRDAADDLNVGRQYAVARRIDQRHLVGIAARSIDGAGHRALLFSRTLLRHTRPDRCGRRHDDFVILERLDVLAAAVP